MNPRHRNWLKKGLLSHLIDSRLARSFRSLVSLRKRPIPLSEFYAPLCVKSVLFSFLRVDRSSLLGIRPLIRWSNCPPCIWWCLSGWLRLAEPLASFNPHLSVLLAQKALSVLTTYGIKPSHGLQGWLSYSRFCPLHRYLSYYFPCLGKVYLYVTISSLSERPLELNFETGSFDARRFVMPTLSPFI
ncbi:hypothetical protein GBA52_015286 [Prunus armeniaca]|nr:hypothetical protein GBA52_015286 [Prunus armeniaca]